MSRNGSFILFRFFKAQLTEEINRLKDIRQVMEDTKIDGRRNLPEWVGENKQFRKLMETAEHEGRSSRGEVFPSQRKFTALMKTDPSKAEKLDFRCVSRGNFREHVIAKTELQSELCFQGYKFFKKVKAKCCHQAPNICVVNVRNIVLR